MTASHPSHSKLLRLFCLVMIDFCLNFGRRKPLRRNPYYQLHPTRQKLEPASVLPLASICSLFSRKTLCSLISRKTKKNGCIDGSLVLNVLNKQPRNDLEAVEFWGLRYLFPSTSLRSTNRFCHERSIKHFTKNVRGDLP